MIRNPFEKEEEQYIQLIKDILKEGNYDTGRNGNNISIFGSSMIFSLKNNKIPLLTSKKLAWKTCLKELLWFIRGETDNATLQSQNVHIWDKNATRNFLDERKLTHYEEGDLGPVYGHQWRHFNAEYTNCKTDYSGKGIDQLQMVIDQLQDINTRKSRRIILTSWNPKQLDEMALPPCHILAQFHVSNENELSCSMYQRSADVGLGVPFNIASYSFLTHLLAKHCDLKPDKLIYMAGNCHIYDDHVEPLKEQINKVLFDFPTIEIINKHENINHYQIHDFRINNYICNEKINMEVRA